MIANYLDRALLATSLALALAAAPAAAKDAGETYYTKIGFSYEKNHTETTNYFKGTRVPMNTQVTVTDKDKKSIKIELMDSSKTEIVIKNIEKYTKVPVDSIMTRYFSKEKVSEADLTPTFLTDIQAGKITVGMTRKDVIASVGYPPAHKTPSLDGDEWTYWQNRYGTELVTFKDGKVAAIKD